MTFPTLYKKTSTGAIQYWSIEAMDNMASSIVRTTYGQVGTQSPQITEDIIKEGKNAGKKNATTHFEQALKEANSKWEKQKKNGYVESIEAAQNSELDEIIQGGIVPMLAHDFSKHSHKIKFPAYLQPKLDGIRIIGIVENGKASLWSRTRKRITGLPHIEQALEKAFKTAGVVLDGEAYNHDFKNNFEKIVSIVKQEDPDPDHKLVQYHVYDIVDTVEGNSFQRRANAMRYIKHSWFPNGEIVKVETVLVNNEEEVHKWYGYWLNQGYEGAMIRNSDGLYVNKRSYDLQKIKEFKDSEYLIIGIEEGSGKLIGHVGSFICVTETGESFNVKMSGDTSKLKEYFENHELWKGKQLTVQYQGLTGTNKVPRFPVGLRIRAEE